jgi:hypothetical protein
VKIIYKIFFQLSLIGVVITFAFILFSNGWNFNAPVYYNFFWAIHYSSIVGLILCLSTIKIPKLRKTAIILSCVISFLIFKFQFNPIDTYEYPHDIKTMNENSEYKIVVRQGKSGKTNEIKIDTVKVVDRFIFRKRLLQ